MTKLSKILVAFCFWVRSNREFFVAIGLGVGSAVWICYCIASLYLMAGGALGASSSRVIMLLAICSGIACALAATRSQRPLVALLIVLILACSGILAGLLFDTSADGQEYHFQGLYALASGWNHYYEPFRLPDDLNGLYNVPWTTHYPKASWVVSAVQLASGIPLEATKGADLALIAASACLSIGLLLQLGWSPLRAMALGLLAAANPVALGQIFTNMNDGILASCLLAFLALAGLWVLFKNRLALLSIAPLMAFAINLKFSAIPLLGAFSIAVCLADYIFNRKLPSKTFLHLMIFGSVAVVAFGFSPYVQNSIRHGHPFYPVMGNSHVDIMEGNTPAAFLEHSGLRNFVTSIFAKTDAGYVGSPQLKAPFTMTGPEIRASGGADVRIAGFGVLFSGAIALSALAILLLIVQRDWRSPITASVTIALFLFSLAWMFPQSWWARYVPFVWLVPVLIALGSSLSSSKIVRVIGVLIATTLGIDSALAFGAGSWLAWKRDRAAKTQITGMPANSAPICIYFGFAQSRLIHFRARGIQVKILPELPSTDSCAANEIAGYGADRNGGAICSCKSD